MGYLISRDRDGDGLVEKPHAANDWCDNIRRSIWVTYDQALYAAALRGAASIASAVRKEQTATLYRRQAEAARQGLHRELWDAQLGYFVNYRRPGYVESNFSIDTLVTVLFGLADAQTPRILPAARGLQTRHNRSSHSGTGVSRAFFLSTKIARTCLANPPSGIITTTEQTGPIGMVSTAGS
jgi:familyl 116 glycosyl hydrolase-like protein